MNLSFFKRYDMLAGMNHILKGCLIASVIFILLAVGAGLYLYQGAKGLFNQAYQEMETELKQAEQNLADLPAAAVKKIQLEALLKAMQSKSTAALKQFDQQNLSFEATVFSTDNLSKSPIGLPFDFILVSDSAQASENKAILSCMYSASHKAEFEKLKAGQKINLRAKAHLSDDGDTYLNPCLLIP